MADGAASGGATAPTADGLEPNPEDTEVDAPANARADAVPWRVFAGVGTILGIIAVLYVPSEEAAGIVMLAMAAILGVFPATFLWRNLRRFEAGGVGGDQPGMYLPEASPWPFGIGLGVALVLNGLLIGAWFLVPGVMVLTLSLAGFARQSRHRR